MNVVHEVLDALIPWADFSDAETQDVFLRGVPFFLVAGYLYLTVYATAVRSIRGPKDSQVLSQIAITAALVFYVGMLATNFANLRRWPEPYFDVARVVMGIAATIGIWTAGRYAWRATVDEVRYWRYWWRRRRRKRRHEEEQS